MSDDFCLIHGYEHMRTDRGPIPYCAQCDKERQEGKPEPYSRGCQARDIPGATCQHPNCDC